MKQLSNVLLSTLLCSTLTGCWSADSIDSDKVDSSTFHINYDVDYDESTNRSEATAQFRVGGAGGTTVRLAKPSEVSVNVQAMNLVDGDKAAFNVIGSYYKIENLPKLPKYEFVYINEKSVSRKDAATLPSSISIKSPSTDQSITKNEDLVLSFETAKLAAGETIEITLAGKTLIGDKKQDTQTTVVVNNNEDALITADKLNDFLPGEGLSISVRRIKVEHRTSDANSQGVMIKTTYLAKKLSLDLVD